MDPKAAEPGFDRRFVELSRAYLVEDYMPRIERCLERLSDEQIWWRANHNSNSIGNLLLHMRGNLRQWIVSGIGGEEDIRRRQREFDERSPIHRAELLKKLRDTLSEANAILSAFDCTGLSKRYLIQGCEVTVFEAVYHVVEHFSMHTGQIILLTKQLTGKDLAFYQVKGETAQPTWKDP